MIKPDNGIIDTLIGFRTRQHTAPIPGLRSGDQVDGHPHSYMFKDIPPQLAAGDDLYASIAETVSHMDSHGIEYGMVAITDELAPEAVRRHPDRFLAALPVDGNKGMDQVREIVKAKEEFGIRAVTMFPAGVYPQIPINDKLWYPIYAKCIELDLPVFMTVGVPGPRVKMMAQHPELLDEVCYDLPELKIVMRHGADPWADLAVKLMLKWPNLYYSTSGFAPKYIPKSIIEYANTRGSDKVIYAGYFPFGIELDRTFRELSELPLRDHVWPKFLSDNARLVLGL